jgi:hypothetical protein
MRKSQLVSQVIGLLIFLILLFFLARYRVGGIVEGIKAQQPQQTQPYHNHQDCEKKP